MTITPDKVIRSGFLENLGSDLIAVNAAGHVIGRASTRKALERACPDAAAVFTESDLEGLAYVDISAAATQTNDALAAVVAQVDPAVLADYEMIADVTIVVDDPVVASEPVVPVVDGSAFDLDGDGRVGGSRPKASRQRKPIK